MQYPGYPFQQILDSASAKTVQLKLKPLIDLLSLHIAFAMMQRALLRLPHSRLQVCVRPVATNALPLLSL